jgi:hypothetical protein
VVEVSPATDLAPNQTVQVTARGLPRSSAVNVVLCAWGPNDDTACLTRLAEDVRTDAYGRLSLSVDVRPVAYYDTYGVQPTYCRNDVCRVVIYWQDDQGALAGSVESVALEMRGSAATIAATPTSGLSTGRRVRVTGTADGSTSRYVTIVQVACWDYRGESGCYADLPLASVPLRADDTYEAWVRVVRVLPDGTDCRRDAEDNTWCALTARFITESYNIPDETFGVPAYGHPGVGIGFR